MTWVKKGRIFQSDARWDWNRTHAQVPVVDIIDDKTWRIYYSARDAGNRGRTSYVDVAAGQPEKILYVHERPIFDLGLPGTFDDCGVMPTWLTVHGGRKYLYYIGWNVRNTVPYHNAIGRAVSDDGGTTWRREFAGPVLDRSAREPYFCGTACVIVEGGTWRNWYLSCTHWTEIQGKREPFYHLKYAESSDGVNWRREGVVAIDYRDAHEAGIVKASVLKEGDGYAMWFCYRRAVDYRTDAQQSYRIGYATSPDGVRWKRDDARAGIDVSADGWDSQMLAYPHVIAWRGKKYLFYNGNGFGQSGFGYAVWA